MTELHANAGYTFLAVALAASLLYRPVIAADPVPAPAQSPTAAQSPAPGQSPTAGPSTAPAVATGPLAGPVQQDFDALISEIESKAPAQGAAAEAGAADTAGDALSDQLNAANIQIGILRQAVVAALAARAEAEAQLEKLWRDSRAEIEALKAAQALGSPQPGALERELAQAKGAVAPGAQAPVAPAAYDPPDQAQPEDELAAGPTEVMLDEVHFDPGSWTLTPGGKRKTLEAADKIKSLGARNVRVAGYTDTAGPAAFNMHLSLQRARSIADLLASVGVASRIIEVEGNGEEGAPEPTEDQVSEPLNRCAGIFALAELPASQTRQ